MAQFPSAHPSGRLVRWGLGDFFWVFFGGLGAALVAGVVDIAVRHGDIARGAKLTTDAIDDIVNAAAQFGVMLALIVILLAVKGRGPKQELGLLVRFRDWYWLLIGMAFAIGANLMVAPLGNLWNQSHDSKQEIGKAVQNAQALSRIVLVLLIVVIAPVTEEAAFRGLLLRGSLRRVEAVYAVLISGIAFGAVHALDPNAIPAIPALVLFGTFSAVVAVRSGTLSRSILMHVGFNVLGVIGLLAAK
jgi:membrane protease YdiL (CAAX protease family)